MDYLNLLEHSYAVEVREFGPTYSRLEFLSDHVFQFVTYDSEMSRLFAKMAVEVCDAINKTSTFEFVKSAENYKWFLLMCNMPFFITRLDWGTSVRGAWWDSDKLNSCGLWVGEEQITTLNFKASQWEDFARAVVVFASNDRDRSD